MNSSQAQFTLFSRYFHAIFTLFSRGFTLLTGLTPYYDPNGNVFQIYEKIINEQLRYSLHTNCTAL